MPNSLIFMFFLIKKGHFGKVAAWAHVTEFQKRGLPHEHFLLIMDSSSKLKGSNDFDKYISAELPAFSLRLFYSIRLILNCTLFDN